MLVLRFNGMVIAIQFIPNGSTVDLATIAFERGCRITHNDGGRIVSVDLSGQEASTAIEMFTRP